MAPPRFQYTITPVDEPHDPWKDATVVGSHEYSSKAWADSPPQQHTFRTEHDEKSPKTDRSWSWSSLSEKGRTWTWWSKEDDEPKPTPMHANWKPLSMTTPILLSVIVASLLMIAAIEVLAQRSQKEGALALSPSLGEIPSYALITSQYVPQLLAVLYSLAWSWIDLDVKRMQPWFELAKPEGALARDSLLLDYPFTFVASVPVIAGRRRHWLVLLSGTTMVLIFWAITPLQSAQIGTGSVNHSSYLGIVNRSELVPVAQQEDLLGPEVLYSMYPISWLDQPYPEFMLESTAFLPFYSEKTTNLTTIKGTNLTAATTQLSTELACWAAEASVHEGSLGMGSTTFDISSGRGCKTNMAIPVAEGYSMFYVGYHDSPYSDFWLGTAKDCPKTPENEHLFLATWSEATGNLSAKDASYNVNLTGSFCQPSYFKQNVLVTIDAATRRPYGDSVTPLASREALTDSEFNRTAFEFLLANGMSEIMKERDHPFNSVLEQHPKLRGRDLRMPVSNMVGFALAGQDRNTTDYYDREILHAAYNRAHQHIFSVAVSQLLTNTSNFDNSTATGVYPMSGIVVSRPISAALEALLLLVAIFTAIIMWISRSAVSHMHANPSSIDRVADIVRESPQLSDVFCNVSSADEDSLKSAIQDKRFRLVRDDLTAPPKIVVEDCPDAEKEQDNERPKGYYIPVKPLFLRVEIGIAFIVAVAGVLGGLGYLKWAEVQFKGLKRPSQNKEVQQILENYIPTILSTMIEPFWILVNRLLCMLQPFNQLWHGNARPDRSVSATYTSIPPQFALWRALKSGHLILGTVCSTVFLANILTISLPAVFTDNEVTAQYSATFYPTISTRFNNQSVYDLTDHLLNATITSGQYSDHAYSVWSNISSNTPLLPWTSNDYFFQPFNVSNSIKGKPAEVYRFRTRGFGIRTNCTPVGPEILPLEPLVEAPTNPNASFCGDSLDVVSTRIREAFSNGFTGACSMEYVGTPTLQKVDSCDKTLTLGWARTPDGEDVNGTIHGSFAVCRPAFETGMFTVDVDPSGYVRNYTADGEISSTLDQPNFDTHAEILIARSNNLVGTGAYGWHNDTLTRDWLNYLAVVKTGSRASMDPLTAVPDPEHMVQVIGPIYRTMFSLLLALNKDYLFEEVDGDDSVNGHRVVLETRLFMDQTALIISIVLLCVNIAIAVFLYSSRTPFVLPRMPTTVGSIIAYVAPSRLFLEEKTTWGFDSPKRTFSFGRFIGRDGAAHVGIEADPHVVPIDPASLNKPPARKTWPLFGKKEDPKLPARSNTWL